MKKDEDKDECISDFGHSRKEEVTSCHQSIFCGDEIPDEEMTIKDFLSNEEINFSNRPSVADVSRSALVFAEEGLLGGLASCVSQENDNDLFEL